jgi:hypothetical protein
MEDREKLAALVDPNRATTGNGVPATDAREGEKWRAAA